MQTNQHDLTHLLYPCAKAPINVHHTPAQLAQLRSTPEFGDYRNSGDRQNTGDYRNIGDLIGTTPVVIGPQYQW